MKKVTSDYARGMLAFETGTKVVDNPTKIKSYARTWWKIGWTTAAIKASLSSREKL